MVLEIKRGEIPKRGGSPKHPEPGLGSVQGMGGFWGGGQTAKKRRKVLYGYITGSEKTKTPEKGGGCNSNGFRR